MRDEGGEKGRKERRKGRKSREDVCGLRNRSHGPHGVSKRARRREERARELAIRLQSVSSLLLPRTSPSVAVPVAHAGVEVVDDDAAAEGSEHWRMKLKRDTLRWRARAAPARPEAASGVPDHVV